MQSARLPDLVDVLFAAIAEQLFKSVSDTILSFESEH